MLSRGYYGHFRLGKYMKKSILNSKGMSLVEVTVAMGISMVVILAGMRMSQYGARFNQNESAMLFLRQWQFNKLQQAFSTKKSCEDSFVNIGTKIEDYSSFGKDKIFWSFNNVYILGITKGEGIPQTEGFWSVSNTLDAITITPSDGNRCELAIKVQSQKLSPNIEKELKLPLFCEIDDNKITACQSLNGTQISYWQESENNIYYNDKIQIGAETPSNSALQINHENGDSINLFDNTFGKLALKLEDPLLAIIFNSWGIYTDNNDDLVFAQNPNNTIKYKFNNNSLSLLNAEFNSGAPYFSSGENNGVDGVETYTFGDSNNLTANSSFAFGKDHSISASSSYFFGKNIQNTDSNTFKNITFAYPDAEKSFQVPENKSLNI